MKLWIDADACPVQIREVMFRAAIRKKLTLTLVANQRIKTPPSPWIKVLVVAAGFDVADNEIVRLLEPGDLVITSDIPLAADILGKGGQALSPRGELFTKENIGGRLNIRDFMDTMRASGVQSGGPPPLSQADRKNFADHLDRILAQSQ
ncbi:YaiI/YqxD family protein [Aliidiomarina iranensis]|uniref:UPF0178 protein CWE08_08785 n=1 Tax=Aliidiomarina iranensis TaxID=1434071 RepID=A0A432VU80_9GAMM|nr:YaiI/YqxD family protein [Aliidiomarina iranensis]RUO20000.1 YaiI/YqxD family protein [Aliidiomarina iranensis]